MPTLTVSAEVHPAQGGPRVLIYINDQRAASLGAFKDLEAAHAAAMTFADKAAARMRQLIEQERK